MSKSALLLMDLQDGIIQRSGAESDLLERIKQVETSARALALPVIYVVVKFRKEYPEVSPRNKMFGAIKSGAAAMEEGKTETEIVDLLKPQSGDIVVTKRRVGAFSGSDLEVVLRSQGIEHLVLTGISTSGVVLSTTRAAADMDYQLTILSDCCHDKDAEVHKVLTQKVLPMQSEVMTAAQWLEQRTATI